MSKPDIVQQFNNILMKKLGNTFTEKSALGKLNKLCNTIYSTALDTLERKPTKHAIGLTQL